MARPRIRGRRSPAVRWARSRVVDLIRAEVGVCSVLVSRGGTVDIEPGEGALGRRPVRRPSPFRPRIARDLDWSCVLWYFSVYMVECGVRIDGEVAVADDDGSVSLRHRVFTVDLADPEWLVGVGVWVRREVGVCRPVVGAMRGLELA